MPTDVTRRADVERLRDRAIEAFGHVDVWVNNAGRGMTKAALELTDDDLDAMITANVKAALYGMQAIVPHFKERGRGQIINISSMLSRVPFASFRAAYSAAKAACARELPDPVRQQRRDGATALYAVPCGRVVVDPG